MISISLKRTVLFGGGGFIGTHLALYLLQNGLTDEVFLVDILPKEKANWLPELLEAQTARKVHYINCDVRQTIIHPNLPPHCDLIVNLAAIHREPGHQPVEYFDTNLRGAETICQWAEQVNCNKIVFTSSIAVYGSLNTEPKSETTLPTPNTPYGISKLIAEKTHLTWQKSAPGRQLLIVRAGVIFGAGEAGNLTKMVRAIIYHYFLFSGNKTVQKAGGYVKELCASIGWMLQRQEQTQQSVVLYNFTADPAPTLEDYARAIAKVAGIKYLIWSVPQWFLLFGAYLGFGIGKLFSKRLSIDPARVRKLRRVNSIVPQVLRESGYRYQYSLETALADWKANKPIDWE